MLLSLLAVAASAGSGEPLSWSSQTTGSHASLRGLHAVHARVCWASGQGGLVLRTVDGKTWETRPVVGAEELDFRDVHAFDASTAVVISAGTPARVYRTEDGGASWALVFEEPNEAAFFDAMDFWDASRGLAFSDPVDGKLLVIATEDGGRSWKALPPGAFPDSPAGEAGFAASGTCLRVGGTADAWIGLGGTQGARVFRTTDGGATWHASDTPMLSGESSTGIFSLALLADGRGIAVGGDYTKADAVGANAIHTVDGGATWSAVPGPPPSGYRSCVAVLPHSQDSTLVAVGPNGSDLSTDGGLSWRRFSDEGFHAVSAAPDGTVWASGSDGRIAKLVRPAVETAAWDRFRGPNGTGIAAGTYPAEIGPESGVLWKRPFPAGHSSPVLTGRLLVLTGVEDERLFTYALDRDTGETLWRRELPRPRRTEFHSDNHAAAASAAVDGDSIVVFFDEFGAACYTHDGTERWRVPMGPFDNVYGMGASPVLVDGVAVLPCDQSTGSFVAGLSKEDGRELWRQERPMAVSGHCTPVVHRTDEGRALVLLPGSFTLDAYDAATGERVWWVETLPAEMKSVPVLIGDRLWIHGFASPLNNKGNQIELPSFEDGLAQMDGDGDGRVSAAELPDERVRNLFQFLDLDADGSLDASEWTMMRAAFASVNSALCMSLEGTGDRTEENVVWRSYRSIPQLPSPLVYGGVYYMLADRGGLLTLLDPDSGEQLERTRLTEAVDSYYASPVGGDGKVYLLGLSGVLTVLTAGRDLESLHTAHFDETCYATPTLEDGRIWLRTETQLFCFGEKEEVGAVDPIVGVWKGLAKGDGSLVPREGMPASFWMEPLDGTAVTGTVSIQGIDAVGVEGTWDPAASKATLRGSYGFVPLEVQINLEGDELTGTVAGMGVTLELEATRISREVLENPAGRTTLADLRTLTTEDWIEDLRFLRDYMPQVHANAFHSQSEESWRASLAELEARLPELDPDGIVIALAQVVARVGDAHTELAWRDAGFATWPVRLQVFADGLFVTSIDERWGDALAARVVRVGDTPVDEVLAAAGSVFAAENESWRKAKTPQNVVTPKLLATLGLIDSGDVLPLVVDLDGEETLFEITASDGRSAWVQAPDPAYDPLPLWRTRTNENYWFQVLEDESAVYFAYNRCAIDPAKPMEGFLDELLQAVEDSGARRLIVDLRNNSGGNSAILGNHIPRLGEHPNLSEPGSIVGLIGPVTYSSGKYNAHQLRDEANAVLIGEPTGGKPNSYGEMRSFRLPNSGLRTFYSTKFFRLLPDSDPDSIEPDQPVELASFEHLTGQDPVLERALGR